ncbi:Wzz/FepE/Etk N-terminal domain-containing protein [Pseudoalteromonas ostreae]|uniref:Wzz/FepE/Etk N-terminal domain-containing protein n=1 Tax=Pseudoalteromonas ostreae TaxID=2774154 RepID=UPI001B364E6B|nr:Wzz/FepE/Etk N-terminal domain-containing protein [Pseudoalteromonas ostreae]
MQNDNIDLKQSSMTEDVDLKELISIIWSRRLFVFIVTSSFSVLAIAFALYLPNIYKSEALIAPAESEDVSGLAGLAGQLGGVASLAGINLSGQSGKVNKIDFALAVIQSKKFARSFFERHNILPELMAVKGWKENELEYDEALFNSSTGEWVLRDGQTKKPTFQSAFITFRKAISISKVSDSGMYTISIEHLSPYIAQKWVIWVVEDINEEMRKLDVDEATKSKAFLRDQIEKTSVMDIRKVLFNLIEEQTKTTMFAEIRDEYIFQTVDPALVPEKKVSPHRLLICILGFLLGLFSSIIAITVKFYFRNRKECITS